MIKLLALDLDGTTLNSHGKFPTRIATLSVRLRSGRARDDRDRAGGFAMRGRSGSILSLTLR